MLKRAARPHRRPRIDFDTREHLAKHARQGRQKAFREPLSRDGIAFLAQMAGKASLANTAESFPHVINKLAPYGYRPSEMIRAIDSLLIDDRPERQGFPFDVVVELGRLRETYLRFSSAAR
jgi:hypothetical protein